MTTPTDPNNNNEIVAVLLANYPADEKILDALSVSNACLECGRFNKTQAATPAKTHSYNNIYKSYSCDTFGECPATTLSKAALHHINKSLGWTK